MNTKARLLKGARVIGGLWMKGLRCGAAWAPNCPDSDDEKTDFCRAKMRWVELATQDGRVIENRDDGVLTTGMLATEFDVTGVTIRIHHPDHGFILIGPKGDLMMSDLAKLETHPEAIPAFLRVLKVFPKSKVVRVEEARSSGANS